MISPNHCKGRIQTVLAVHSSGSFRDRFDFFRTSLSGCQVKSRDLKRFILYMEECGRFISAADGNIR
jgi:hypothetical protein